MWQAISVKCAKRAKSKKDRKKNYHLIIIAIVVAVLIVMKVCEININTVKEHFTDSMVNFPFPKM